MSKATFIYQMYPHLAEDTCASATITRTRQTVVTSLSLSFSKGRNGLQKRKRYHEFMGRLRHSLP